MSAPRTLLVHPAEGIDSIRSGLEEHGCQVTNVRHATTALTTLANEKFDCLVTEHTLPGDDGLSLLRAVRETYASLPVVMFTDCNEITDEAFADGAARLLPKNGPESVDRLAQEVTDLATRGEPETAQDISGHEPSPEEIVRAINEAPIGISLSDPTLPDNPLVFVTDTWREMTGYDPEYMLGRNPRLLQGPETDPETVETVAEAIDNEEPVTVEIRNYRRDGTPFWNELTVAPVRDDDGDVTHYVGFQNDVSERHRMRALAEERSQKLDDERRMLRQVLGRVNELLEDLSQILIEASNRDVFSQRVCDAIVDLDGYTACWIGSTNAPETRLELTATTGVPTSSRQIELDRAPESVERTITSGEIEWCTVDECSADVLGPDTVGTRAFAAVPIATGQKCYGLLGVYGDDQNVLNSYERTLFQSIGKMIANGLSAIETSRILTTDPIVEVEIDVYDRSFPFCAIAGALDGSVEYVGMTDGQNESEYELFVTTQSDEHDQSELTNLSFVEGSRAVSTTDTERTLAISVDSDVPVVDLAEHGAAVAELTADQTRATLVVEVPPGHDVRSLLEVLQQQYERVELCARCEREQRKRTPHEFTALVDEQLTDRQHAALEAAQMNGYFEWPRPIDGSEIAATMGITRQTFHQHLRAAERKLVEAYLES